MIESSRDGDVVTIALARPERRNALDPAVLEELRNAVTEAVDGGARAIVLTGRGPVFCAGADLSGPVYDPGFLDTLVDVLRDIESVPVPIIAAVNGPALGAGLQLAMIADLRVAAPAAFFGIPAAKIGVAVDSWTIRRLATFVGGGTARGILLGVESVTAERALDLGFVNRLGDLAAAQTWAAEIAQLAPLTLAHAKLVLNEDGARDEPPQAHVDALLRAWRSEDVAEGRAARAEKRTPVFRGR